MTPAMAAGLTTKLLEMGDLVVLIDAHHEREVKRSKLVAVAN
jgi:hypothetical protein